MTRDEQIIDLYLNHPELSSKEIANQFGISTSTISRIARINNLPRRKGGTETKLSIEQEKEIINRYQNEQISLMALEQEYKISYERLLKLLEKYSCKQKSAAKRLNKNLKEDYFDIIDNEDKAYWLGFLIADGAITYQPDKSKYQLELTLQQEDEHILHQLEQDLGVENKVYTSNNIYKRFSLGSEKLVTALVNLGITQNKSFTVKVPNIDSQFHPALIRGLFDGDGGFTSYYRSTGQKCNELSFCGNENVVTWIQQTLFNDIPNLSRNNITKESSIKRIRWSSLKDINLIKQYLYQNHNEHYLLRKYNLIQANTEVTN